MCRLNITTLFTYRAYTVYIILQNVLKVLQVITILVRIKSLKTEYFVGLYSPPPKKITWNVPRKYRVMSLLGHVQT